MIFFSANFNIRRITNDQKQTPCTNTTEEIEDIVNDNQDSDADDDDFRCNDDNSNINSNNQMTTKREDKRSLWNN